MAKYANLLILIIDEWLLFKSTDNGQKISLNYFTEDAKNLLQSFAHNIKRMGGTINLMGLLAH